MGRLEEALTTFHDALGWYEQQGKADDVLTGRWMVARCLRSLRRYDEALTIQEALLKEHSAAGSEDGFVHEELGELYLALGRKGEATPHFGKAFELLSKESWLVETEAVRLARIRELAGL